MAQEAGTVVVHDLWESFRIYTDNPAGIRDRLAGRRRKVAREFWALQAVSFDLARGETLALIGPNGSGKSTLLKCLARILTPTRGEVVTVGRTTAMLELGAGFHGDLTGRENIYLNASILGLRRRQVDAVFDEIVAFSELEAFIDAPLRTYSSGMYLRLGFSVSVHLDPDILIIDEVLAVGDARFVARCFDRIGSLKRRGVTIIVVTHDLDTAASLGDRGLYLEEGVVKQYGNAYDVVTRYRADVAASPSTTAASWEGEAVFGTGELTIDRIWLESDAPAEVVPARQAFSICLEVTAHAPVDDPIFGLTLRAPDGTQVYAVNTMWQRLSAGSLASGARREVRFHLDGALLPGRYLATVAAARSDGKVHYDWHTDALTFDVVGPVVAQGYADLAGRITVEPIASPDEPAAPVDGDARAAER
jgi:ABC-type polysaccharide/polyol phosphate transport system ATPase subunit